MFGQTTAPAQAYAWHPPLVFEVADIAVSPPAAQLKLSARHPKKEHTDHERAARMNAEAQDRWRGRLHDPVYKNREDKRHCCTSEYNGLVIDFLIAKEWLNEDEAGDPRAVGRAISEMLMEAALLHWRENN